MLRTLRDLFQALSPSAAAGGADDEEHLLQLATAVMLVEVMRAEGGFDAQERQAVLHALRDKFALAEDEAARLAELAEATARESTDLYAFTSRINERFEMPQKLRMIEHMWRVAYADGRLGDHERHLVWRIADLLHIPQGAYVHARLRAEAERGAQEAPADDDAR